MANNLPDDPSGRARGNNSGQHPDRHLVNIENLHLQANDLDALRRLAEVSPDLADKVVEQRDNANKRDHASFRLGVISASSLVVISILALSYVLVKLGVLASFLLISGVLAIALLIRVVLTGEWSETSWFGQTVQGITTLLGGKVNPPDED